ncbi:MAG: hypothetical protein WCH83_12450 [Alphaproteobacteria bacterium]
MVAATGLLGSVTQGTRAEAALSTFGVLCVSGFAQGSDGAPAPVTHHDTQNCILCGAGQTAQLVEPVAVADVVTEPARALRVLPEHAVELTPLGTRADRPPAHPSRAPPIRL